MRISFAIALAVFGVAIGGCVAIDGQHRRPADTSDGPLPLPDPSQDTNMTDPADVADDTTPPPDDPGDSTDDPSVSPAGLPTGTVTIGGDVFRVEIARTEEDRIRGLMERESLAADAGMLFLFDAPQYLSFWMANTLVPLDVAFIREDLTISSIDTMEPLTLTPHPAIEPVPMALEVLAGEFARRNIGPGDKLTITGIQ
jgi:hypothetical protein